MTDADLRALVREAVERRFGADRTADPRAEPAARDVHPSHAVYVTVVNGADACVIEPGVPCTHCNYCRSHGY